MFETTRFDAERLVPASAVIAVSLAAFGGMMTLVAPGILGDVDVEALMEQFPPALVEAMGLQYMGTMEGFIALELYQFIWLIGLGAYVAYSAAGTIAGDVDDGRMDTLLAAPVSRGQLLVEKYLAFLLPIVVVNLAVFAVVYGAASYVDDPIAFADLAPVHVLSVPYFLLWGAFGMLASVVAPRRVLAEGVAAGAVIGAYLLQTLVAPTDFAWLGAISPMRYYDPLTILTASDYDLAGAGILLASAVALLVASVLLFREVDVQ